MSIKGWSTQEKEDRLSPQYATVEGVRTLQNALSVVAHQFVFEVGTDTVEAASTTILINATGHSAKVGDVIRFTSGTLSGQEVKVYSVATNSLTLAEKLPSAPALGVSFQILRHKYPLVDSSGVLSVSGSFSEGAVAADGGALPALTKVVSGYDGSAVQVLKTDSNGELQVDIQSLTGTVDTSNSTTTPLTGGASFTGTWVVNKDYASLQLGVKADQNSATDGLEMQFSNDGSTVHHVHYYSYLTASGGIGYLFQPEFKYYRVKYTNGASAQTSFTLSLTARSVPLFPSQYRVSQTITSETQAIMTKSVITGETTAGGGGFVNVKVNPSGALTVDATLSALDAALDGQKTMASSLPVVIASDQTAVPASQSGTWNITNISGTISLPTNAATSAKQDTGNTSLSSIDGKLGSLGQKAMTGSAPVVIASDQTAIPASQSGTWNIGAISTSVTPGTAAANLGKAVDSAAGSTDTGILALAVRDDSLTVLTPVDNDYTQLRVNDNGRLWSETAGKTCFNYARIDYTSTSVTTGAYVQLLASTLATITEVEIFDSSGQTLFLAYGSAGSETNLCYITPGGNGRIPVTIPNATRVAIKAVSATANAGEITVNFYGR